MTKEKYEEIFDEVIDLIENLLVDLRNDYFTEYVLLIARAEYNKNIDDINCDLIPYDFYNRQIFAKEITREKFMVDYTNRYKQRLLDGVHIGDDEVEYDINIQLMIYSHVWESQLLLKILRRITTIVNDKGYEWRVSFVKNNDKYLPKYKFIEEYILEPLKDRKRDLYDFIVKTYDNKIRNVFSHADYRINTQTKTIITFATEGYGYREQVTFDEWEGKFLRSILFSYYLQKIIFNRLQNYIVDESEKPVTINIPSRDNPEKMMECSIEPYFDKDAELVFFRRWSRKKAG